MIEHFVPQFAFEVNEGFDNMGNKSKVLVITRFIGVQRSPDEEPILVMVEKWGFPFSIDAAMDLSTRMGSNLIIPDFNADGVTEFLKKQAKPPETE